MHYGTGGRIHYSSLSHDGTVITLGTSTGFALYNVDPFGRFFDSSTVPLTGAYTAVELVSTQLVALVGGGATAAASKTLVTLFNLNTRSDVFQSQYTVNVEALHVNRQRIVVVLGGRLDIYSLMNGVKLQSSIPSPKAATVFAVSPETSKCYLAFPGSHEKEGLVIVHLSDERSCKPVLEIAPRGGQIDRLAFNPAGTLLAVASDDGMLTRVYEIPSGNRVGIFRRGITPLSVTSLSFAPDSHTLALASSGETVHLFGVAEPPPTSEWAVVNAFWKAVPTQYMPTTVADAVEAVRRKKFAQLPDSSSVSNLCAITATRLYVLTVHLKVHVFDIASSGETCPLINTHTLERAQRLGNSTSSLGGTPDSAAQISGSLKS